MNREFVVVDEISTSLCVTVRKTGDDLAVSPSNNGPVVELSKHQILKDGYVREGEVCISAFTLLKLGTLFEPIIDSFN